MKKRFLALAMVALVVGLLSIGMSYGYSEAADDMSRSGYYIGVATGLNNRGTADDKSGKTSFKSGAEITADMGVRLEKLDNKVLQNLRFELEYSRQYNDAKSIEIHSLANKTESAVGTIDNDSFQFVIYYDFPFRKLVPGVQGFLSHLSPYVGLGLGFDRSILSGLSTPSLDYWANLPTSQYGLGRTGGFNLHTTTDYEFCKSVRFGVTYEITKNIEAYLGAKYQLSNKVMVNAYGNLPNGSYLRSGINFWDGELGVRYNF